MGKNVLVALLAIVTAALAFMQYKQGQQLKALADAAANVKDDRPLVSSAPSHEPELAAYMGDMARFLHKFELSVRALNGELAGFYLHELEELAEDIGENVPEYDGHRVGELTLQMLLPAIESVESEIKNGMVSADQAEGVRNACNSCHLATDHGFVVIESPKTNPFNQTF